MRISEYKKIEELEDKHFWYRAMEEHVLHELSGLSKKNPKILDAGCGTGGMSVKMKKYGQVYAIDVNPVAIEYAKKKIPGQVLKATAEKIPFKEDFFDVVVCLDVLYHKNVSDDQTALNEIHRVLKKGGVLILRLPAFEALRGGHDKIVDTRHRYRIGEVNQKLLKSGFKIMKLSYANMLLSIPLFAKRHFENRYNSSHPVSDSVMPPKILNTLFYYILSLEMMILHFLRLPFGSSVFAKAEK